MNFTREQEAWAVALWVDREHGEEAEQFIAGKVLHFVEQSDDGGRNLWEEVARRYLQLCEAQTAEPN